MTRTLGVASVVLALAAVGSAHAQDVEPPSTSASTARVTAPSANDAAASAAAAEPVTVAQPVPAVAPVSGTQPASASAFATDHAAFRPFLELFAEYRLVLTRPVVGDMRWFHEIDLPRAHVGLDAQWGDASGRVVLEATRSGSAGALIGVAGDSLVLRLREASLGWDVAGRGIVSARGGVVPTLAIPEVEEAFASRAIAPSALEETALASPADLGATARLELPRAFGHLSAGIFSGEGYTSRERNRGKNVEVAAVVHPFATIASARPLAVLVSYTSGSSGTTSARADRLTASLLWNSPRLGLGAVFTLGWGVEDASDRRAWVLEAFARGEPVRRLLLSARAVYFVRDTRVAADVITRLAVGVGWRIVEPLQAHLVVERALPGDRALAALPDSDEWRLRIVARAAL